MAYLHHILFDPLSMWEHTKVSLFVAGIGMAIWALAVVLSAARTEKD